jgi:hypothetical protein
MRAKAFTLAIAVVVLLGVIGALQYSANARLRSQVQAAKTSRSQTPPHSSAAPAVGTNPSHAEAEAARLRAQIHAVESQLETLRSNAGQPPNSVSGPRPPSWTNLGNATPMAAVETGFWAQATGNTDVLARSISFDSRGKLELQKMFSALDAEDRQYFATPERMAAELITQLTNQQSLSKETNGAIISLVEKSNGADAAEVVIRMTVPEKNFTKDVKTLHLQRATDGWKMIVPAEQVSWLKNALVSSGQAIPPTQRALRGKR